VEVRAACFIDGKRLMFVFSIEPICRAHPNSQLDPLTRGLFSPAGWHLPDPEQVNVDHSKVGMMDLSLAVRPEPKFIVTERGVGYTFNTAVEILYKIRRAPWSDLISTEMRAPHREMIQ
jgi:hypothetical protein